MAFVEVKALSRIRRFACLCTAISVATAAPRDRPNRIMRSGEMPRFFHQQIITSQSVQIETFPGRAPVTLSISPVVIDKDLKAIRQKFLNIPEAVTDIAGVAVAEKNDGGFSGQREKPSMEFCSVARFKVYGLILQTQLIRGHIKIGLGME